MWRHATNTCWIIWECVNNRKSYGLIEQRSLLVYFGDVCMCVSAVNMNVNKHIFSWDDYAKQQNYYVNAEFWLCLNKFLCWICIEYGFDLIAWSTSNLSMKYSPFTNYHMVISWKYFVLLSNYLFFKYEIAFVTLSWWIVKFR